jgi:myo-inositol 2-dehydrogenase / D-chiro-inositol 1-dehydrogenase
MVKTVRYGLIGTGMMGLEHIQNIRLMPGAQIVALHDPEPKSLEWAKMVLGDLAAGVTVHGRLEDLVRDPHVDALVISSPNHTHAAVLDRAIGSGKHILCEKPLATSLPDALRVREAALRHNGVFWVGMEYRYMPPAQRFIADVKAGRVGRLVMLSIREHRFPFLKKVGDWNRFSRNTGGTMVEKCCHFFDLMRLIVGAEPVRVFCSGAMDVNHRDERYGGDVPDIRDNSFTTVEFSNGVRAMLDLCMFAEGAANQEEITAVGDQARLDVFIPEGALVFSPRVPLGAPKMVTREAIPVDPTALKAGTHHGATYFQHQAFLTAIRDGAPVAVTAEDGFRAAAIGMAAERSAREGRAVSLSELGL